MTDLNALIMICPPSRAGPLVVISRCYSFDLLLRCSGVKGVKSMVDKEVARCWSSAVRWYKDSRMRRCSHAAQPQSAGCVSASSHSATVIGPRGAGGCWEAGMSRAQKRQTCARTGTAERQKGHARMGVGSACGEVAASLVVGARSRSVTKANGPKRRPSTTHDPTWRCFRSARMPDPTVNRYSQKAAPSRTANE